MVISRWIRAALVCCLLWPLTMTPVGCGRARTTEEPARAAADPGANTEAPAQDDHHGQPGSVELSPAALKRAQIRIETVHAARSNSSPTRSTSSPAC